MGLTPEMIDAMVSSGCTAEQIAAVVKASLSSDEERKERKRENNKERQQRFRNARNALRGVMSVTKDVSPAPPSENAPPSPPKGGSVPPTNSEPEGFSAFWQAYPNKTGKPKALEAYRRALRRAGALQILAGLNRVKAGWDDPRYIPHPQTWLNRDGWDDQPVAAMAQPPLESRGVPVSDWTEEKWRKAIGIATQAGVWEAKWGPPPDDPKTLCPPSLKLLWTRRAA